jgi:hypothetical protein
LGFADEAAGIHRASRQRRRLKAIDEAARAARKKIQKRSRRDDPTSCRNLWSLSLLADVVADARNPVARMNSLENGDRSR